MADVPQLDKRDAHKVTIFRRAADAHREWRWQCACGANTPWSTALGLQAGTARTHAERNGGWVLWRSAARS